MTAAKDDAPRFKMGCLPLTCLLLLALIFSAAVALRFFAGRNQRAINDEIARLRASEKPATVADLTKWHALPVGATDLTKLWLAAMQPFDNPAYHAAGKGLPIVGDGKQPIPLPGEPWAAEPQVEQFLAQYQATLDQLHDLSQRSGVVRYPHKFEDGLNNMLLAEIQRSRGAARLLTLNANVHARKQDATGVTQDLHAVFRTAATLDDEPLLVAQLLRMAVLGIGCRELARLSPFVPFTPADLELLQRDLATARTRRTLQQAIYGDRVFGLAAFQEIGPPLGPGEEPGFLWQLTRGADAACYLDVMRRWEAALEEPWPQAMTTAKQIERDVQVLGSDSPLGSQRFAVTMTVFPSMTAAMQSEMRSEARLAAAETGVAVQRYRLEQRKLPSQLSDLVPKYQLQIPIDPYDGQPLRYIVKPTGYVVYSVGKDGKDDGGQDDDDDGKPDVAFREEKPPLGGAGSN